ncbi:MAG: translation initiation factor IF-2 [Deltaproteobacteria bacterium]|nr:translation initiation factor IF-2 [Deltaproteobacteria bacterium]
MAKIRVYELARELGKDNKSLVKVIRGLGIEIKNQMSTLAPEEAQRVRDNLSPSSTGGSARAATVGGGPAPGKRKSVIRRRGAEVRRRRAEREEAAEQATAVVNKATGGAVSDTARPAFRPARGSAPEAGARPGPRPPMRSAAASVRSAGSQGAEQGSATSAPEGAGETGPDGEPLVSPAVGTRIELPRGTRRLPGGMAARIEQQATVPVQRRATPSPRPAPAPQEPVAAAPAAASAEPAPAAEAEAPAAPATEGEAAPKPEAAPEDGGRRVVRNEDGVIVGARSQRSEPKILGFIPLAQTKRRQQVIITDAADEDRKGRASQRKQREEKAQAQGRRRKMNRGRGRGPGGPPKVSTQEMSEEKKRIRVDEAIQVSDLAHQMSQKASVILRQLWSMGLRGITINHAIDFETAEMVAAEFAYTVENVAFDEEEIVGAREEEIGKHRAPVVTFMGHVDHGKTSLLDKVRESRVAAGEAGGITQHIGAYRVDTAKGPVVFLDTPGHEAFTAMRSRGAQVTDLVVLVVAADDGVMPTTIEAIAHSKEAGVPIVVAVNKIDKPDANPGRVKQSLMEQGLVGEEFGGDVAVLEVSAKTGQGVDELIENLALQAEVMELRAPDVGRAQGVVLEARIDKGRGTVATVLVQTGKVKTGDIIVANEYQGKVRGLYDDRGRKLKEAGPSMPVEVLGLSGVPAAGDRVDVVDSDRDAKALVTHRREQRKRKESVRTGPSILERMLQRKKTPVLKIVLKSDVQGSAQALHDALEDLSTEKVKVEVIKSEVGQITENDVKYARAGDAVIFGFNVKPAGKAAPVADQEGVSILTFSVIYEATEKCEELMISLLEPEYREREQGEAEVRALFPIPRLGVVAGCRVIKGLIQRSSHVRVHREAEVVFEGLISSLRVFKDDVREVKDGFECGIVVDGFTTIQEGDVIHAFAVEEIPPTL